MAKSAVVIGASGGMGGAFADLLAARDHYGCVYRLSRSADPDITSPHIFADVTSEDSLRSAAEQLQKLGAMPEVVIVATGILHSGSRRPERSLRELDSDWMAENYLVNAIGPALAAKHFMPLLPKKGRSVFAVLSARVGSISDNKLGGWYGYRASKAALNMIVRNLALEVQRKNPDAIVAALHPGTVVTALSAPFSGGGQNGERFTAEQSAAKLLAVIDALTPADTGQIFDYDGHLIAP
jgi:NAD(P)-dependent dehydrogenase (short-subunit alcohol dehydrogenase family)